MRKIDDKKGYTDKELFIYTRFERFGRAYRKVKEVYKRLGIDTGPIEEKIKNLDDKLDQVIFEVASEVGEAHSSLERDKIVKKRGVKSPDELSNGDIIEINQYGNEKRDWFLELCGMSIGTTRVREPG